MTVTETMLNEASNKLKAAKVMLIDLDDIEVNKFNKAEIKDIEDLAESIKNNGLMVPITVYKERNHHYILLGGERRYRAHQLLAKEDPSYSIIQAVIQEKPEEEIEERVSIIVNNAQREQTKENIKMMVDELSELYDLKSNRKDAIKDQDIINLRKRDWISLNIGYKIAGRTIQEYLTGIHALPESEEPKEADKKVSSLKSITKKVRNIAKIIDTLNFDETEYTYQDLINYQDACNELFYQLNTHGAIIQSVKKNFYQTQEEYDAMPPSDYEEQITLDEALTMVEGEDQ